jgi:acetyl esterase/lipase
MRRLAWFALAVALLACGSPPEPPLALDPAPARPGELWSVARIAGYPAWLAKGLVWWSGRSEQLPVEHGVTLYRVEYWTTAPGGEIALASGLVALPRAGALRGAVSWQHGTTVERREVPSKPTAGEGVVASLVFAGHGYLLTAPDYLGLGTSAGRHPYYHAASTAAAVVDLLRAARRLVAAAGRAWPERLFLAGFSQGGHATIAALRALEAADEPGLRVTAAASIAGPFDLSGVSFPRALAGEAVDSSLYLAYLVSSYARIYGEPLEDVLTPEYARAAERLFDGTHEGAEVVAALPRDPREMFEPAFLAGFQAGQPSWLRRRLRENDLVDFTPHCPVRAYYGRLDVDVSPQEARSQAGRWSERGVDARAVDVGDFDHEGSVLAAAPLVRRWFDALARSGAQRTDRASTRILDQGAAGPDGKPRVSILSAPRDR